MSEALVMCRRRPELAARSTGAEGASLVWAVMLWRASDNPADHVLFIDFTIWANLAHGLVMLIATSIQKGPVMMVIEGLPLFVIAAVLLWLRPRQQTGLWRPR